MNFSLLNTTTLQNENGFIKQHDRISLSDQNTLKDKVSSLNPYSLCSSSKIKFKFILKLLDMLNTPDINGIISWSKEGNSFIIKDIRNFIETILPCFYKHNSMSNFIRQLNMYNFKKLKQKTSDPDELVYHNPLFIKDNLKLIATIDRKIGKQKGQGKDDVEEVSDSTKIISLSNSKQEKSSSSPKNTKNSIHLLKRKLNRLKASHEKLQTEHINSLNLIEANDVYVSKLETIFLYLANQLKKNALMNQERNPIEFRKKKQLFEAFLLQELNDITSLPEFISYLSHSSQRVNDRLSPELSFLLNSVIAKYKQNSPQNAESKSNLQGIGNYSDVITDPKSSQGCLNITSPILQYDNRQDNLMNLLELNDFNKFAFKHQLSNQSSFKSTTSKFDLFTNPNNSNPNQSFNREKLEFNSFSSVDQYSMTMTSLNDCYFEQDLEL